MYIEKWFYECFSLFVTYLCLQLVLALLQLRDVSVALSQHGLLLLEGKLQLQVLLVGALTDLSGTTELLLQRRHLKNRGDGRCASNTKRGRESTNSGGRIVTLYLVIPLLKLALIVLLHLFHLLQVYV